MSLDPSQFPQLTRMESVQDESQAIGSFLDWLSENGMTICRGESSLRGTQFIPILESNDQILAKHFQINLNEVEKERRAILSAHRAATESP